ncbi:MAG: hypothetical protein K5695_10535 [Oscillospiraceae bacterium]|nr:hypothetical protein [Oscillospiraceae bacterium]
MKRKGWKRIGAALLAAAMSLLQMPAGLSIAEDDTFEYYLRQDTVSEGGVIESHWINADGEEYVPDLIPDYGARAGVTDSKFDLRTDSKGLPAIRNQGRTGTCWAHATLGAIESNLIHNGLAETSIDLSESHLIWFSNCMNCSDPNDPLYGEGVALGEDGYMGGGNYYVSLESLASWSGYELEANTKPVTDCPTFAEKDRYNSYGHVQGMDLLDTTDIAGIKSSIVNNGGLYTMIYYDNAYLKNTNSYAAYNCPDADLEINHAVLIVGWDDNFSKDNFMDTPSSDGAWLCRNSYGSNWGKSGYFYLSYEDATMTDPAAFHAEEADNYDNIYQYDRSYYGYFTVRNGYDGVAGANIFTTQREETLSAVSFMTSTASVNYTVRVYKDVNGSRPSGGTLASEVSGTALYAGYHTVDLTNVVNMKKGTRFSVVVILDKGAMETDEHSNQSGVSYVSNYSNRTGYAGWSEPVIVSNSGEQSKVNVCIKAFTRTGIALDEDNFPDPVIRNYAARFDANKDGILTKSEIASNQDTSVDLSDTGLTDITGLEIFKNIRTLNCSNNPLCMLDLSDTNISTLICEGCSIELGTVDCKDIFALGLDEDKLDPISGMFYERGQLSFEDNTLVYTYDCGNGQSAIFTIEAEQIEHTLSKWTAANVHLHYRKCVNCGYREDEYHVFGDWVTGDDGEDYITCTLCGYSESEPHSYGDWEPVKGGHARTCIHCKGTEFEPHTVNKWTTTATGHSGTCTVCNATIDGEAHDFTYKQNSDGTHTATCTVCGYETTSKHNFGAYKQNADGTHTHTCTDCGYVETSQHNFGAYKQNADGTHTHTCTDCGYAETSQHSFGAYKQNADGTHTHTCTDCGYAETSKHSFGAYKQNADGTHTHTCTVCGYAETSKHSFGAYKQNADGTHTHTCKDCGYAETSKHSFGAYKQNADGTHTHTCKDCGFAETSVHTYGQYVQNADGTHTHTCTLCGYAETAKHTFGTCTDNKDGTHTHTCKYCSYSEVLPHDFGDYVQNADGTHTHTCKDCGASETSAHHFTAYTAGTNGKHTHTCKDCGYAESFSHSFGSYTDNKDGTHSRTCKDCSYAEVTDHTYGTKYTITKDSHSLTCTKCGHVETVSHNFGTCTDNKDGTHSCVCADCRYVKTAAHNFSSYVKKDGVYVRICADCGVTERLLGDVSPDGKLDVLDIIALQKFLHGRTGTGVTLEAADMNGDGVIDVFDLALLKRAVLAK